MIKKIFTLLGNLLLLLVIVVLLTSLYSLFQSKNNPDVLPSVLGFNVLTVQSGSMEPSIKRGDLIIVRPSENKKLNDVVTYRNESGSLVTHRIVNIVNENETILYQTKGDANNVVDNELVSMNQLIGTVVLKIPKLGTWLGFFRGFWGMTILILIPFFFVIIGIVKKMIAKDQVQGSVQNFRG